MKDSPEERKDRLRKRADIAIKFKHSEVYDNILRAIKTNREALEARVPKIEAIRDMGAYGDARELSGRIEGLNFLEKYMEMVIRKGEDAREPQREGRKVSQLLEKVG